MEDAEDLKTKVNVDEGHEEIGQDGELNTYDGISQYYDALMTHGYYDYADIAKALHELLYPRRKVLELGVGTGLLAEELLAQNSCYLITGVDNTLSMLKQAKERLHDQVEYRMQDITCLELEEDFEAAFSVGGCWYFIDTGEGLEFCSHIADPGLSREGLERVIAHISAKGVLALSLQGVHTNYSKNLSGGLVYSQSITKEDSGFLKKYVFRRGNKIVASQEYRYLVVSMEKINTIFSDLGCDPMGLDRTKNFFVYRKR